MNAMQRSPIFIGRWTPKILLSLKHGVPNVHCRSQNLRQNCVSSRLPRAYQNMKGDQK